MQTRILLCSTTEGRSTVAILLRQSSRIARAQPTVRGARCAPQNLRRGFGLHAPTRVRSGHFLKEVGAKRRIRVVACPFYAAVSNRALEMPRSSNNLINVSSIKLLGHEAPAVMPTTTGPGGNQKWETTSRFSCRS